MNRPLPEMLHSITGNNTEMTVLERQRARFGQDEHFDMIRQHNGYFVGEELNFLLSQQFDNGFAVKLDPGWSDLSGFGHGGFGVEVSGFEDKQSDSVLVEKLKKRKADHNNKLEALVEEDYKEKKMKACSEEGDSKITEQNSNNGSKKNTNNNKKKENSPDNSKISEVQKPDYIHVRARRGQATDSHSLAERVRREKISERMKYLQDLVPGCNKITGKAGMLDEIINYVQSLQKQVEFLSMKLATVNPTLDFNIENLFAKEVFSACSPHFPLGLSSEITNPAFLQFSPLEQLVSCSGLDMGLNTSDVSLRRSISVPVSMPETFIDPSTIFNQIQSSPNWDANLQSLNYGMEFVQGRSTSFPPNHFAGPSEASNMNMKMEMM